MKRTEYLHLAADHRRTANDLETAAKRPLWLAKEAEWPTDAESIKRLLERVAAHVRDYRAAADYCERQAGELARAQR